MKCPECGGINKDGSKYCQYCGEKFSRVCPGCGKVVDEGYAYCPDCGAKLDKEEKKQKRVEYDLKDGDIGFRYAYVVSNVLLFVEAAWCILSIIMSFTSYRTSGPGYYSFSSFASIPPYSITLLVLSLVSYFGLKDFKKSSYVILIVIHALLLLRDITYIRSYFFFYGYGIFILYGILAVIALVLNTLSLVYFVKRKKYYSN